MARRLRGRVAQLRPRRHRALFSDDVAYAYHPYDEPIRGAQAVADSWLENQDEPGSWEASYAPALIAGDEAIATGETRYTDGEVFSNLWRARVRRRRALHALRRVVRAPARED